MNNKLFIPIICALLLPATPILADETAPSPTQPAAETQSLFQEALNATPPQRSSYGLKIFNSREATQELDNWIENAGLDDPKSLIIKDILSTTPPVFAGPRIVALAKKSTDSGAQNNWARWLKKYPDAYASVLVHWLKLSNNQPSRFLSLLQDYAEISSDKAMAIWLDLIAKNKLHDLQNIALFGFSLPQCADAITQTLSQNSPENTASLRLQRALVRCKAPISESQNLDGLQQILSSELDNQTIATRIAALQVLASPVIPKNLVKSFHEILIKIYDKAQNTTEKSIALLALDRNPDENQIQRLTEALTHKDETLRFYAASIIADHDQPIIPAQTVQSAFQNERWPDTQQKLYEAIVKSTHDKAALATFQKSIIRDENRPVNMRISAIDDIFATSPNAITLQDMADLQNADAPVEVTATIAEHLYRTNASARPKLRQWIIAQQPFERRILSTFALFVRTDEQNQDDSALETMRTICSKSTEQQNILLPCINYMSSHAQTDKDRELLENMQTRRRQIDAMTGMEL